MNSCLKEMRHNFVACKFVQDFFHVCSPKYVIRTGQSVPLYLNAALQYCSVPVSEESLPLGWYDDVFPRLIKLSKLLKNVDLVDGRLVDVNDNSTVRDERLLNRMLRFKALARAFLGHPSVQEELMKNVRVAMAGRKCSPPVCFTNPVEREPLLVNNLTKVCNYLDVSAQQRKTVRFTICPQVAQHRIFTGALEEILEGLKREMMFLDSETPSKATFMGQQIVTTCLNFLAETACRQDEDASSWMRPKPYKSAVSPSSRKWEEVLEMFNDLIDNLRREEGLSFHVSKLKVMKEGLIQIKDVLVDRDIGFKEVQHHESLVHKKLLKTLGHSSQCLFTLVRYYLHESVRDMEVEVSGGLYEIGEKDRLCLCMGKLLTSSEERMVWSGIKQLDRALGLFKFVWETAGMNKTLELQGHLWCVGAEPRTITYRGNLFILHGLSI
ncbi:uncharacterized protein LOC110733323 [Chenopodium quinoa]|uniref:uncharacterized protein LOC110733323 n=1 Tax=Chenopodium quinoa TaxID=63459 RepID=UPI000B791200|nr:uncharacterized protein LOC110733323 [Chenopodium quinoa]XP_021769037.1 uncharacterized protein LOC110733323 [Chenopodium quinoa]